MKPSEIVEKLADHLDSKIKRDQEYGTHLLNKERIQSVIVDWLIDNRISITQQCKGE